MYPKIRLLYPLLLLLALNGCAKNPAVTVPPGALNATDADAFRVISDAQAAILSVKGWQACSAAGFPSTVAVDGATVACNATAGQFPPSLKAPLNTAISAYNVAQAAGQAYHSGASSDAKGLTNALTQLQQAISALLTQAGVK